MPIGGAAVSAGGSLLSGILGSNAASDAASVQAKAARTATNLQGAEFLATQNNLNPYMGVGLSVIPDYVSKLQNMLTPGAFQQPDIQPPNPTTTASTVPTAFNNNTWGLGADQQKALEATPGYQFTLNQGLRGVQNAATAQGRGVSGDALAGAANYATGLANSTFSDQYKNALSGSALNFTQNLQGQQQAFAQPLLGEGQQFNQLLTGQGQTYDQLLRNLITPLSLEGNALSLGENAAARTGDLGQQAASNAGNLLTSGAAATAGGIVGSNNALSGAFSGIGNSFSNLAMLNLLTGGKIFGGTAGGAS